MAEPEGRTVEGPSLCVVATFLDPLDLDEFPGLELMMKECSYAVAQSPTLKMRKQVKAREKERRLRYSDQETKVLDGSVDRYTGGDGGNEWLNKSKGKEDVGQGQDGSLYI